MSWPPDWSRPDPHSPAPDPRMEVLNVYRYILNRWSKAKVAGDTQRAIHLFQALDTIRAEWPEVIAADEEA